MGDFLIFCDSNLPFQLAYGGASCNLRHEMLQQDDIGQGAGGGQGPLGSWPCLGSQQSRRKSCLSAFEDPSPGLLWDLLHLTLAWPMVDVTVPRSTPNGPASMFFFIYLLPDLHVAYRSGY